MTRVGAVSADDAVVVDDDIVVVEEEEGGVMEKTRWPLKRWRSMVSVVVFVVEDVEDEEVETVAMRFMAGQRVVRWGLMGWRRRWEQWRV